MFIILYALFGLLVIGGYYLLSEEYDWDVDILVLFFVNFGIIYCVVGIGLLIKFYVEV